MVVTARTRCGWVNLRERAELLYGKKFPPKPKGAVQKSYVRPVILYGSEAWCMKATILIELSELRCLSMCQATDHLKESNWACICSN